MITTQGTQTRTYIYDALHRLTSETNPETGTTTYAYDSYSGMPSSAGDLIAALKQNGDGSYFYYDALHRVTDVGWSGPDTYYCKRFRYDNTQGMSGSIPPGVSVSNTLGHLAEAETDNCSTTNFTTLTDEWFSYDVDGHLSDVYESTPNSGGYYHTTATYWANGTVNTLSGIPRLSAWTFAPDGEGRPNSVTYGASTNWVSSATYYPSNPQTTVTFSNGDSDVYNYDASTGRMNQFQFTVGRLPSP